MSPRPCQELAWQDKLTCWQRRTLHNLKHTPLEESTENLSDGSDILLRAEAPRTHVLVSNQVKDTAMVLIANVIGPSDNFSDDEVVEFDGTDKDVKGMKVRFESDHRVLVTTGEYEGEDLSSLTYVEHEHEIHPDTTTVIFMASRQVEFRLFSDPEEAKKWVKRLEDQIKRDQEFERIPERDFWEDCPDGWEQLVYDDWSD